MIWISFYFYSCERFEAVLPRTILLVLVPEVEVSDLCYLPGLLVGEVVVVVREDVAAVSCSHLAPGLY